MRRLDSERPGTHAHSVPVQLARSLCVGFMAALLASCAAAGPVSRSGDDELRITTDAIEYVAGEPITAAANLEYLGDPDHVTRASLGAGRPISFVLRQLDGPIETPGGQTLHCGPFELRRGAPLVEPFSQGGFSDPGTNDAFYAALIADPILRLPTGRWELAASARMFPDCNHQGDEINLRAATQITVR